MLLPICLLPCYRSKLKKHIPEIYRMPTRPVSWLFRTFFRLAAIIVGLCNVTIKQLLLPAQVALLDPTHYLTTFALIASVGGLAGVIGSPLTGALSDRTVLRWGRRRPWIIFGIIFLVTGLLMMALSTSIYLLLLGEILVQISSDTIFAVVTAIIPDQIPAQQRGTASALAGMAPFVGGLIGVVLITLVIRIDVLHHPQQGYILLAGVSTLIILLFLAVLRRISFATRACETVQPLCISEKLLGQPQNVPRFGFVWLSRCLVFFGYSILLAYLLFYLKDVIHFQAADKGVTIFQIASTLTLVAAAIVGGIWAEKLRRLKPFVSCAAIAMAIAMLMIALIPQWPVTVAAAVVFGMGFGVYLSVDVVLSVKVLPAVNARAKDLSIINTAIFIPIILAPLTGGFVLSIFHSYMMLFTIAAVLFLFAALLILPIKSVR